VCTTRAHPHRRGCPMDRLCRSATVKLAVRRSRVVDTNARLRQADLAARLPDPDLFPTMGVRMRFRIVLSLLAALVVASPAAAAKKALFDNTKAETAANADWVIDTDQPVPVPDQSAITWATSETYWTGAISSWGVQLVKRGYTVATLTPTYGITYGDGG